MSINFNANPYWDDFDASKNYKRILAVPGRVEQSREFTQIQTALQHQLTQLGNSIYKNGQIVTACDFSINEAKTRATIAPGTVYVEGDIVAFTDYTTITITGVGTEVIGLVKTEEIITELEDPTLRDPAQGYDNYQESGAHRLKISWSWELLSDTGYGVFILIDGVLPVEPKPVTVTEDVLDIIARRDYEQLGNYALEGLKVSLVSHPDEPFEKKQLVVTDGKARILGYNVSLIANDTSDFEIARETATTSLESKTYTTYDTFYKTGGTVLLGDRPVAYVDQVIATELTVDGSSSGGVVRPPITRGSIAGGSDSLSRTSVVSIIAVNKGGAWNPATEAFVGGTTYAPSTYTLDGNRISWAPVGAEPAAGDSYNVAYLYRKVLVKQQMEKSLIEDEALVHGDSAGNDTLAQAYVCETNEYTGLTFYLNDDSGTPSSSDYERDVDFVITENGVIDWYDHDVQILSITKGAANSADTLTGFTDSYTMGDIIGVAFYTVPGDMEWNSDAEEFVSPTATYTVTTDYEFTRGVASIDWSAGGTEPAQGATYAVAVRARKYKTANHPQDSATYYANYYYWNVVVPGDYLARDSFYSNWVSAGHVSNVLQHYGLDIGSYLNFWRAFACQNYTYNSDKPYPDSQMEVTYRYYLSRFAIISLHSTEGVAVDFGQSAINPTEPNINDSKKVVLATVFCPADSLETSLRRHGVRTFKMKDHHKIKERIETAEVNIATTWLDLDANAIPVSNKKGLMTTSFADTSRVDTGWAGSAFAIDPTWEELALPHTDSFHSSSVDVDTTTATVYQDICTIPPNGTTSIEQADYSGNESIAPYALAAQSYLGDAPSAYMTISPTGDTLVIPRTQIYESLSDVNAWLASDIAKLSNPTQWFSKGWTGGTETRTFGNAYTYDFNIVTASSKQTETLTATYIRDIQGNCRQIEVSWNVPGGMIPSSEAELDYFIYFGGVRVSPTLTNATPPGSVTDSFRPRAGTNAASGTFTIPPNIPEGRIEVRISSTSMLITDESGVETLWNHNIVATYDAAVVEQLTMQYQACWCNCYCNCWCNCYNCRGRCGTGPLAQTIEPTGVRRVLKELQIDFATTSFTYGVFGCMVKTDNGQPTSNTIETGMVARKYLPPATLSGGGMKTFTFDNPLFMDDEAYAIVVTGEDQFNLNSVREVAAGRDIRCKVAKLGDVSQVTGLPIGSQPFKAGVLWRSLTGVTWEQDQTSDLKFKATFNTYPANQTYYVYLDPITTSDATAFLCAWDSDMPDGTSITFQYRTPTGVWTEFLPYSLTYINEVSNELEFRAKLITSSSNITPFCSKYASFYVQSQGTTVRAVTRNFELSEPADVCDVYLDSHLPSGYVQDISLTFDNGTSWVDLDNSVNGQAFGNLIEYFPVDLNVNNVKYRHHWKVTLNSPSVYSNVRVKMEASSSSNDAQLLDPRFSRLVVIASTP